MKQTAALTNTITPRIEYTTANGILMLSDTTNVGVPSGGTPPVIIMHITMLCVQSGVSAAITWPNRRICKRNNN